MSATNNSLSEAFADIIKPIVEEAVRQAFNIDSRNIRLGASADSGFLTIKHAAAYSGLGTSTIRKHINQRKLPTLRVGRRLLIKRTDLEAFLESNPIPIPDKLLI